MTHDIQTATVAYAGERLRPESIDVQMDRTWSPYIQGTIVLPGVRDIDADGAGRVRCTLIQTFSLGRTAQEIADLFPGDDGDTIATAWTGLTASEISATYATPLNSEHIEPTRLSLDLRIRDAVSDLRGRTTTIDVASDEDALQVSRLVATAPLPFSSLQVRDVIAAVLALFGFALESGSADGTMDQEAVWVPGETAWDFISPLFQQAGLRLYCDEQRRWHLVMGEATLPGTVALSTAVQVSDASSTIDRAAGGYDSAVIEYEWTDAYGAQQKRWDVAGPSRPRNTYYVKHDNTPYPGPGAATFALNRMRRRRRRIPLQAASNFSTRPTMAVNLSSVDLGVQSGRVQRVRFAFPDKTMRLDAYDLEDVSPTSIVAIPASYAIADLPGTIAELTPPSL